MPQDSKELTALSHARWEPMGSTVPLPVVVKMMLSAHLWTGLALARQAGTGWTAPSAVPAVRGASAVT